MTKAISIFILVIGIMPVFTAIQVQVDAAITVTEMMFCTGVEDRVPVGVDTMFLNTVGQVHCFTKITGVSDSATVSHVWYYEDQEVSRVDLKIMGDPWRTWSSKKIMENQRGTWQVDVVTEAGEILKRAKFTMQSAAE